ncbi:glycosyl hydrolase family 18 protein [Neobacillus mesonae]|uniref:glycosyl hydrolase family 18 protein n=1 Tax=Neobacillus mesonae TaxID=1193713 RepID=UPI00203EFE4B|nr:LysM peptidoglycan-binding domain-containing protein [Neobacillus mesonae]MCM3570353.1 LysM peptidoglycan-binding domain-containing protein [Neobacillus mesonae]
MAVHVVRSGENLWRISTMYGISISNIMKLNGLSQSGAIVPGLALYLPDSLPPNRSYRIKAGDMLWKLAMQYHTNSSNIIKANPGINPYLLSIGQIITIPSPLKLSIQTLGFMMPTIVSQNIAILNSLAKQLTYLAVVSYSVTDVGWAFNIMDDKEIISRCHQLNIKPLLVVQNIEHGDFSADLAGKVLENPNYRKNLSNSLVNLAKQRGFSGVSIDFEFIPPERRQDFITFLTELKNALGSLILHVNLPSKIQDLPTNPIIGAYDYAEIAKIADLVAVMTMDYGYAGGPPDPVSPINWMEQVIKYSLTQIPNRKMQIAFPLYGHDKLVPSNQTVMLSVLNAQNQAISKWVSIQYDNTSKAPWYRYWQDRNEHVVWFEDIRSYIEMYKLVDLYQLAGSTYWELSFSAPQNWAYLGNNISVIK